MSDWIQFTPKFTQKFAWWQLIKKWRWKRNHKLYYRLEGRTVHIKGDLDV